MARIHARVKGNSGPERPVKKDVSFVQLKKKEVEDLVVDLAKKDYSLSMIGIVLRDKYGVPSIKTVTGKSVSKILSEKEMIGNVPEDLQNLVNKVKNLNKHLEANPKDTHNRRGKQLIEAKIRRLAKYYKDKGVIPKKWSYN